MLSLESTNNLEDRVPGLQYSMKILRHLSGICK